jgi:opacity protein-like surface antigen
MEGQAHLANELFLSANLGVKCPMAEGAMSLTFCGGLLNYRHEVSSMKKILLASVLLGLSTSMAFPGISLKLTGGMAYLFDNDYTKGIRGLYNYYQDSYEGLTGKFRPLRLGLDVGGEVTFSFGGNLAVGFGAGYLRYSRENEFGYQLPYFSSQDSLKPDIRLIPLTVNIHYYVPWGPRLKADWFIGAGYYLMKFDHTWSVTTDFFGYRTEQTFHTNKGNLGFQGGFGLELEVTSQISLVFQASGRFIKFSDLKGDLKEKIGSFNVSWENETGNAYFWFYGRNENNAAYAQVIFAETKPSETEFSAIRKGILDLNGIAAGIGLKFSF